MKLIATILGACVALAAAQSEGPSLNLPQQWSAKQVQTMVLNEGGEPGADGAICCPADSPECKVQTAFQAGMQYFDLNSNSTAYVQGGQAVVTLFNDQKEYAVDSSGNCQSYCPISGPMYPFALLAPNATDLGATTYKGIACTEYMNRQAVPILNITMEETDTYAILGTGGATDTPVAQVQNIMPLGQQLGQQTVEWQDFKAGAPPASVFTVNGKDSCPMSNQCQGDGGSSSTGSHGGSSGSHSHGGSSSSGSHGFPSTSSSSGGGQHDLSALDGFHRRSLEEKIEALNSFYVPPGYNAPSALWPRPKIN